MRDKNDSNNTEVVKQDSKDKKALKLSNSLKCKKFSGIFETKEHKGSSGYRSVIFSNLDFKNYIYFETTIASDEGFARIGFATVDSEIYGPVGIDSKGYSFGSRNGYIFHKAKRLRYGERYFKDDIISGLLYTQNKNQQIMFFVNGEPVSAEPVIVDQNKYYPAVSVCKNCILKTNVGPYFAYEDKILMKYSFIQN